MKQGREKGKRGRQKKGKEREREQAGEGMGNGCPPRKVGGGWEWVGLVS